MRNSLVTALVSCADSPHKSQARRFANGLSSDELQFIAEFLGARILDSIGKPCISRTQWAECITRYQQMSRGSLASCAADREHKMVLLLEFLCRIGVREAAISC